MNRTYIALGGNLGDVPASMGRALGLMEKADCVVLSVSHVYETEPWGIEEQPLYANAVAVTDVPFDAPDLLDLLKETEARLGRVPGGRYMPRTMDLDILLFGDEEWDTEDLTIPHPRMLERDFVVTPLLEVDPEVRLPDGTQVTREHVSVGRVRRVLGRIPGFEERTAAGSVSSGDASEGAQEGGGSSWSPVYEFGVDPVIFSPTATSGKTPPPLMGKRPNLQASFAQMVLEQEGIPYAWDPFPPEQASDPYGFGRHFRLMVPSQRVEEAVRVLQEAASAKIDWSEADFGP